MKNTPSLEELEEMYRKMLVVRRLEETLGELHKSGKTRGPLHRCDGQEAVGIGATAMLNVSDLLTSTHRGHAHYVGKGLDIHAIAAEILGRETGYCAGRAGHMLVADASHGMIGGNAIVGAGIPAAIGMGSSIQIKKSDAVAMCIFGDGAAQTGICHESMNIAALWRLPVVFVLEHNEYGLTVHSSAQSAIDDLHTRAAGYGMPGERVDGNDVAAVYKAVAVAVERARRGEGPSLVEAKTYRMAGFSTSDMGGYQSPEDIALWKALDPLDRAADMLLESLGAERLEAIKAQASRDVDDAFERALGDPLPEFSLPSGYSPYREAV